MKKSLLSIISIVLLIIISSPAFAAWYLEKDSVTVDLNINAELDISRSPGASLDYVTANVSFIPLETSSQSIVKITADPEPKSKGDEYQFRWDSPVPSKPGFEIDARVKTKRVDNDIRKIAFPYIGFTDEVSEYLVPGKVIDSDHPKVIAKASELAAGETDYYAVVFKMADWTKENVEYDLSTLNRKASQKASYVLAHKDGVCDEITTLFIGMLRAVGIPAKFVAGIAYTDSDKFPVNWGAHGWAEVYFPGTGWVPFDVTYGQYGYVDPTHIKLKEAVDAGESDTKYEWLGHDVDVIANPISVSAELLRKDGSIPKTMEISVDVLQKSVGLGSYNLIEATVTNKRNSYVSTFLFLAKINELEVDGNNYKSIMLAPKETKKFYWLVKVMDNLDSHYTYTFPITIANLRNTSADSAFVVVPGATVFSRQDLEQVVDAAEKEEEKRFSKKIDVNCTQENQYYYTYDDPKLTCTAKNTGNFPFKQLKFCFEEDDECRDVDLGISQEKGFDYTVHGPDAGVNKVKFTVMGADVSKTFFYDIDVFDEPELSIDDISFPAQIEFRKPYEVTFTLKKESTSIAEDIIVTFDAAGLEKKLEFNEVKADKKLVFNLDSEDLSVKPNVFNIAVNYEDMNGKLYTAKDTFEIELINVSFGQRVVILLYDMDKWLRNLFK